MEGLVILIALGFLLAVFVLPIAAFVRAGRAQRQTDQLITRITALEVELVRFKRKQDERPPESSVPSESAASGTAAKTEPPPVQQPLAGALLETRVQKPAVPGEEPVPASPQHEPPPFLPPVQPAAPPPLPPPLTTPIPDARPEFNFSQLKGTLNWEQFMGAKLFAWIGGLALFLGVAYFVKYSFEHNLIPPEVRVAIGFLVGMGLVATGVIMRRKEYAITAQTLCATGILILYAVTFACRAVYHFPFFGPVPTFALMTLVTATAFLLAVRMEAQVVAILGILGGFLTPVLLSTGQDAPVALFAYIGLLDAGLLAVALHQRWLYLAPLAAAGTVLMQLGWTAKFFQQGEYFSGNKVLIPMTVLLFFNALWLAATRFARRRSENDWFVPVSTSAIAAISLAFGFYFICFAALGARPWLLFSFVFLIDASALTLTRLDRRLAIVQPIFGAVMFLMLSVWLAARATNELLPAALVFTLVFAAFHSLLPLALQRRDGEANPPKWSVIFPPIALIVLLVPIFKLTELTFLVWPFILMLDVLAIVLAVMLASALPVLIVLVLTLIAAAGVLFKIPAELTGLPTLLLIVGACALFFSAAGFWLWQKRPATSDEPKQLADLNSEVLAHLPSFAIVLPFALLVMMVGRLPLANPSPVFGLAGLLVVLLFAVTWKLKFEWLPLIGLGSVAALEYAWHQRLFTSAVAGPALTGYLLFFAAFAAFPFVVRHFNDLRGPWIAAALAGPIQFFLVHSVVKAAWPNSVMGLLPAAFAIPALVSLVGVLRLVPVSSPTRLTQLALFGGVALFFITLIFPIQFDRQWLTIAWALEGAALCWLFHRLPHPGLRVTGVALLVIAFVRLALNPAVLGYHARSITPLFNWYLYTYGIVAVSLFAGARLLAPPRERVLNLNAPPMLAALGTVLAFLLVNIQIADYFTEPGAATLTFKFSGNFGRDLTYSIAWALFALVLLIIGLVKRIPPARYAALGLLGVTLVKLFFHDLAKLQQLYRIAALIGVAVIAIVASFLYQRFSSSIPKRDDPIPVPPAGP
jgi:uncharacterized membrane protein